MRKKDSSAILSAVLAAALYGISTPISKLLLTELPPTLLAAVLYFGAGLGMLLVNLIRRLNRQKQVEANLSRRDIPYVAAMIILDIAAPVFLMTALTNTAPANVSLLNNFEIVATALIALALFHETIGRRMWLAIALITLSTLILSFEDWSSLSFSAGSLFAVLACVCWGLENNCTRKLSLKDPLQIVVIKGFGSGSGSLLIALGLRQYSFNLTYLGLALLLGFAAYGLSIYFYIRAQRELGAARTSAYYAVAPFVGVLLSMIIFDRSPSVPFLAALAIMIAGACLAAGEYHKHRHIHESITHEHRHSHDDLHHNHHHDPEVTGEHSHMHTHESLEHEHRHTPDLHHTHNHVHKP
ncbi:MAG: DMT family transporter [Clostridiaceae bacterium]|nr:DMT family transporter [Clostridiaceae bacterium]